MMTGKYTLLSGEIDLYITNDWKIPEFCESNSFDFDLLQSIKLKLNPQRQ